MLRSLSATACAVAHTSPHPASCTRQSAPINHCSHDATTHISGVAFQTNPQPLSRRRKVQIKAELFQSIKCSVNESAMSLIPVSFSDVCIVTVCILIRLPRFKYPISKCFSSASPTFLCDSSNIVAK